MLLMNDRVRALAETIWDYHHMHHDLDRADAILVLCSHDTAVADLAWRLRRLDHACDCWHRAQTGAGTRHGFHSTADLSCELGSGAFARIKQDQYFGHACQIPESQTTRMRSLLLLWE